METSYKEIMEHIAVTEDMRQRILHNIQQSEQRTSAKKRIAFSPLRRSLGAAACFAVLLAGVLTLMHLPTTPTDVHKPPVQSAIPSFKEASSVQALSEAVGFEVEDLAKLPFDVVETHYVIFGTELAEIRYSGVSQSAVYRKALGEIDPSGDYTQYASIQECSISGKTVTLRGAEDGFRLAVWFDDAYAYSLRLESPLTESAWAELLENIL